MAREPKAAKSRKTAAPAEPIDQPNPGGAPSKYDPAYCQMVIDLGNQGASVVEMAHEIGVCRATLEANWPEAHPEFLEALTRAKQASQVWWEKTGRSNLATSGFQSSMWSRSMAARFPHDWREVSARELSGPNGQPIPVGYDVTRTIVDPPKS